jgi:Domain of unknown function (DUF4411)
MAVTKTLFNYQLYIIDMSSLKELHDRYPKTLFPTIWQKIETLIQNGQLYSHIEVQREIKQTIYPTDKLLKWSNKNKKIFLGIDSCQIKELNNIRQKFNPQYWNNEINRPGPWADPYLIATAICEQAVIVTQENKTKTNRIPPIAAQFKISTLNMLELFHELKVKL